MTAFRSRNSRESQNIILCRDQLKRWLKCRGLKQGGKREEILKRVKDCIFSGSYRTLDSSIDDGKWFALKAIKENSELKGNNSVVSLPVIPTTGWREFQSHDIPSNYGHIHYYARWNPFKMWEVSVTRTDSDIWPTNPWKMEESMLIQDLLTTWWTREHRSITLWELKFRRRWKRIFLTMLSLCCLWTVVLLYTLPVNLVELHRWLAAVML